VSLDISSEQQRIKQGESLLLKIDLGVLGGNIDQTSIVELEYSIKDLNGSVISAKKESGAIAVKESEVASLLIPTNTKPGVYTASVIVIYQGETYEGSKTFEVTDRASSTDSFESISAKVTQREKIYLVIIIILSIFVIYYLVKRIRKNKKAFRGVKKRKRR
jgi:hypothetical protein